MSATKTLDSTGDKRMKPPSIYEHRGNEHNPAEVDRLAQPSELQRITIFSNAGKAFANLCAEVQASDILIRGISMSRRSRK
jgi:hypothetical protein